MPLAKLESEWRNEENRNAQAEADKASFATYYYHCDQIGAPLELTDEEGEVAWAADYKVWGEAVMRSVLRTGTDDRPSGNRAWGSKPVAPPPPPPIEQPFRFQGQQFDEDTGLNYNRFRYYDLGFNSSTITPIPGNR